MPFTYKVPSESAPDFGDFVQAVVRAWGGLLTSGMFGAGLLFWGLTGSPLYPIGACIISLGAIFVACYQLWATERQKYLEIIEKKEQIQILAIRP